MAKIKSIELFSGAGGLALGLENAGIHHEALYEWDKHSCNNLEDNISKGFPSVKGWKVYNMDVRDVDYTKYKGKIDIVSGGPPCQPFSMGGKAKAYKDKRDMWPEAIRAVRELQPRAFIFENVKGLLRPAFSDYFQYILLQLQYPDEVKEEGKWEDHYRRLKKKAGSKNNTPQYDVTYNLVNVADYGVPQVRYRVIIVGFRHDLKINYSFPNPIYSKEALLYDKWISGKYWKEHKLKRPECPLSDSTLDRLKKNPPKSKRWKTVRDALKGLPDPSRTSKCKIKNHEYRDGAKVYAGHSGSDLDEPSKTIKAGVHGVPGGENMVVLDDGEVRYYTVRESARIQTFDDDYEFVSSWGEAMRQIGNAVPVLMAETIGKSVVDALNRGK